MMHTIKSGLTIGMLVTALAMTGGCGENDNSGNGNDNGSGGNPTPRRTSTPVAGKTSTPINATATPAPGPTSTPGGVTTTATVDFDLTATAGVQGFKFDVGYPAAKGNFQGSKENVVCTTASTGTFVPNDNDTGILKVVLGNARDLTFPINISCKFDQTSTLAASDLTITITEVTQNGVVGDKTVLTVTPTVKQP